MTLPAPVVPELCSLVGDEHVPDSSAALEPDAPDATPAHRGMPDAVVFPVCTAGVAAVVALDNRHGSSVSFTRIRRRRSRVKTIHLAEALAHAQEDRLR